jgi:acyl-coenzyme A synthetase/AMP-(fatty) acid ligase
MNLAEVALRDRRHEPRGDRNAFLTAKGPVTIAAFRRVVFVLVNDLAHTGIKPGDRVLLRMTNSVEFAAAFLAVIWLGAIPVLQNSQFRQSELEYVIALAQPTLVILSEKLGVDPAIKALSLEAHSWIATRSGLMTPGGARPGNGPAEMCPPFEADRNAAAFIVFTSGTTGKPKGIVHAHRWLEALGDSNVARVRPEPDDVALSTGEWSFISALGHNVLFPLRNGVAGSVMEDRASPERILATIERDRVTLLYSVATLYRRILSVAGIEHRYDVRSLRGVNSTGEPLEDSVRKEWQARFGCPIWEHYGISEAQMLIGDAPGIPKREGSAGRPWGAHVAVLDDNLNPLPSGSVGTLAFRADYPGFFLGYLGDERQTRATVRGGWFISGDLARMDNDDYVYILGRRDYCFKSKGVLIAPRELEDAILGLGDFAEACVFPIPDPEIGNKIGAAVVRRPGTTEELLEGTALAKVLSAHIAPFKLPHRLLVLESLPKNANGKIQRSEVARLALLDQSDR